MKKMNIAVMLLDLSGEYMRELVAGIKAYFREDNKEVNTIMCQVKLPNLPYGFFEYQYWAGLRLLESDSIDAVIVVSSFFLSSVSVETFSGWLQGISHKPVISIGARLDIPGSIYLRTDSSGVYSQLFKHLIEKHGCKKIAFMSANGTSSNEARERFESYKFCLQENNLPYDESLVYEGNFTSYSSETAMKEFKTKEDIPFDAIICANDLMAVGIYNYFSKIGVSVPEDVIVTGFDDSIHAHMIEPTMTTVSQQIWNQGWTSADLIYRKLKGENIPEENLLQLKNVYRQSCGCIAKGDFHNDYLDENGYAVLRKNILKSQSLDEYLKNAEDKKNIYMLLDVLQVSETLTDLFTRFKQILFAVDVRRMAVVLFDDPIENNKDDDFYLPQEVELSMVLDRENGEELVNPKIRFNPKKMLVPETVFNLDYDGYTVEPIFYGNKQYGYMIIKLADQNYYQGIIYIKEFSAAIASSYEFTRKQEENLILSKINENLVMDNSQLNETSKTDELTQVFNRRGFMFNGKQILALTQSMIRKGTVFFCDMDGLKTINDTYGHQTGDEAIKCIAEALKRVFSLNDVIGRLGGDEFAVISGEITAKDFEKKYKQVQETVSKMAKRKNLPCDVSVSMGVVEFTNRDTDLEKLLARADESQYEMKKKKKAEKLK